MFSKSQEDYLEAIYNKIQMGKKPRAIDIVNEFNVTRATISEALIKLSELDLINYESRKEIKITQKGEREAKKIINKHKILKVFLNEILNLDTDTANKNACQIEHVINEEVINKIEQFNNFCLKNKINKMFKENND